ncbi:MAG: hypothetical protein K2F99_01920, partial [Muribaculaceae bacterium]|nr:hypothetical protein [Muribaculaceae bacterium]
METNYTLNGKVTIISAFPSLGKTTAAWNLKHDPMFIIEDLDSGTVKADTLDINPNLSAETLDQIYVELIKSTYAEMKATLLADPLSELCAGVLFVSAHDRIRQLMSDAGLEFIYVVPDADYLDNVKLAALQRLTEAKEDLADDDEINGYERAYD